MILGILARPGLRVMVASKPVDFRKGMDGLVALTAQVLAPAPAFLPTISCRTCNELHSSR